MVARLKAFLLLEHNEDGSHNFGTADSSDSSVSNTIQQLMDRAQDRGQWWKKGPWLLDDRSAANPNIVALSQLTVAAGTYNDFSTTGIDDAIVININPDGGNIILTGLKARTNSDKRLLLLRNGDPSSRTITLKHADSASITSNRFQLPGTTDIILASNQVAWLYYDSVSAFTDSRWHLAIGPHSSGGLGPASGGTNALLDASSHSDTTAQAVTRGSLIYGNSTPKWDELVIGAANRVLRSDGTDASWAQVNLATDVTGTLPSANGGTGVTSGAITVASLSLSEAQLESMDATTGIDIVAAGGAGTILIPVMFTGKSIQTANYSNNPNVVLRLGVTGSNTMATLTGLVTNAAPPVSAFDLNGVDMASEPYTGSDPENKPLTVYLSTALTGTGSVTMQLTVAYYTMTVT